MHTDLTRFCIDQSRSLRDAVALMDQGRMGIALVVDSERRLLGTVTDGDVRRAMLERVPLDRPVTVILDRKAATPHAKPVTASVEAGRNACLELLRAHRILHLPLLDRQGRVAGLVALDDFLPEERPLQAVVMAGGFGRRLTPLTRDVPKPLLPIGDRPIMEIIIRQLREAGIRQVKVTTHHQSEKIADYFKDGKEFGVELSYVTEDRPLGTIGGLGLLEPPRETTLVINGDILTQVDFRAMLTYHKEHQADLTVAVRHYDVKVPYGVIECDGPMVKGVNEKPVVGFFVNAGIYLLEPAVYRFIRAGERLDMTELIHRLLGEGRPVVSFPIREYWLDIGEHSEYARAGEDMRAGKVQI